MKPAHYIIIANIWLATAPASDSSAVHAIAGVMFGFCGVLLGYLEMKENEVLNNAGADELNRIDSGDRSKFTSLGNFMKKIEEWSHD